MAESVSAGQGLVALDSGLKKATTELTKYRSTMEGAIQASESRSEYATLKHHRREQLLAQKFVSVQDCDEAATEKRLAEAELREALDNKRVAQLEYRRASEQLRLRTVRSPFSGIVVDRMLHPRELADARSDNRKIILRVADITVLHVEALLPLEVYGKIKAGQLLEVFPEAPIGGSYKAKVKIVDKVMDTASGTFGVRMEIPNEDFKLPAGIKCKVSLPGVVKPEGRHITACTWAAGIVTPPKVEIELGAGVVQHGHQITHLGCCTHTNIDIHVTHYADNHHLVDTACFQLLLQGSRSVFVFITRENTEMNQH